MKIEINYDLLDKVREAKKGFSLNRFTKYVSKNATFASAIYTIIGTAYPASLKEILNRIVFLFSLYAVSGVIYESVQIKSSKYLAIDELKKLSNTLKGININTDYELLLKSYKYHTDYKIEFNKSKIPYLKQRKYVMIPIYDNGEEHEMSLVQEHVVGSKRYYF